MEGRLQRILPSSRHTDHFLAQRDGLGVLERNPDRRATQND